MALIASLVVGRNGATSLEGKSAPLSTPSDRERFLSRHRSAAAFIIGKKSALLESYSASKVPIFVFSRSSAALNLPHPLMQQVTVNRGDLGEISRRIDQRIAGVIVIEAGASLLTALIDEGVVDEWELSISPIDGDGDFIELVRLLKKFEVSEAIAVDGTRLLQCRYKGDSANS
jgi:riboflavin biosynthesis pyrimidine reductase